MIDYLLCDNCKRYMKIDNECYSIHYKRPMGIDVWLSFCSKGCLKHYEPILAKAIRKIRRIESVTRNR